MHSLIVRPIISEKSMTEAAAGKFTFEVLKEANKNSLRKEVEERFKVNVLDIAILVVKGKTKKVGARRREVKRSPYKKAYVRLKEGQKIELFDIAQSK